MDQIHPKRLDLVRELGRGSFGCVNLMRDRETGQEFAVKVEASDTRAPQLHYETRVLCDLRDCFGIVPVYARWERDGAHYMAMMPLGASLEACRATLCTRDLLEWVAPQAIRSLRAIHEHGYLHRDIKPDNFLTGPGTAKSRRLYLVDCGLCKRFRKTDGTHIPFRKGKRLTGTARYCSIGTHEGFEQSRRDDLEALGHTLLYIQLGSLPWQQSTQKFKRTSDRYAWIASQKVTIPLRTLCGGAPEAFLLYLRYVRALAFDQTPDYDMLTQFFRNSARKL